MVVEMKLDPWQEEIMAYDGNILLAKGRRIGATHIMGKKAVEYLRTHENHHPKSQMVCVSLTEDQAELIISFATNYAQENYPELIGKGKNKPTLRRLILVVNGNRRILLARPVGATGDAVRGFEGQILMVDEAPKMPKLFWASAKPILATTGGKLWIWGTFFGQDQYFYKNYLKAKRGEGRYKLWEKTTPEVFRDRLISESWTEGQKKEAFEFLEEEKEEMTKLEYAQEYLAMASENLKKFLPDELIKDRQILQRTGQIKGELFLGIDVARLGKDLSTFEIFDRKSKKDIRQVENITTSKTLTTDTTIKIFDLEKKYNFKQIFIDAFAVGVGIFDRLITDDRTKRKTIAIDHWSRPLDRDEKIKTKVKAIDLFENLKSLMEHKEVSLLDDDNIRASLSSLQYEYNDKGEKIIIGSDKHIADGIVRGVWCSQDKSLNIWIC